MKTLLSAILPLTLVLGFSSGAVAQLERAGLVKGVRTTAYVRSVLSPSTCAVRVNSDWLRFGAPLAGVSVSNRDLVPSTQDTFKLAVLVEFGSNNNPRTTPLRTVGPLPVTNTPISVSFPPLALPTDGKDIYLAVEFKQGGPARDGGWTSMTSDRDRVSAEVPGPRLPKRLSSFESILLIRNARGNYQREWVPYQMWLDPLFEAKESIGGVAVAKTNQRNQPGRNNDQTIAGFLSGIHPDAYGLRTATRRDSFGFCAEGAAIRNGDIVVFMLSHKFGKPVKIPGVRGIFHLEPTGMLVVGAKAAQKVTSTTYGARLLLSPPATRVTGVDIFWQAMVLRAPATIVGFTHASIQRL